MLGVCFWTAVNAVYIMCQDESSIYVLMVYSYSLLFILPICVLNQIASVNKSNLIVLTEYVMNLLIVAVVLNYCHFANAEYLAMDLSLQQMESYYTTLITQVKINPRIYSRYASCSNSKKVDMYWEIQRYTEMRY